MSPFATDAEAGFAPQTELASDLDAGFGLDESNYGSVAAIQIEKRRDQAKAAGSDLNQNEQVAIMDSYRQLAGLEPMTYNDTFAETQRLIAERQSGLLNLARSTSAAFQNQAVNVVAPAVDLISPGWGTKTRADIATLNPYDPSRLSGKAGGAVAAAPLLLAGGSIKAAAAVFGMNSAADTLARAEDTGVEGIKKWGGAAGSGAITAGAIMVGGKLAQWAGKALGAKLPHLKYLISQGRGETIGKIIGREAALAGISLPTQGTTMLAGTIADNLLAQKTTDPNRKWDDGLGDTAFNVAAMTLGTHIARAGAAAAARGPTPTAMVPSERGQGVPEPGFVRGHTIQQPAALPGKGTTALAVRPKGPVASGAKQLAVHPTTRSLKMKLERILTTAGQKKSPKKDPKDPDTKGADQPEIVIREFASPTDWEVWLGDEYPINRARQLNRYITNGITDLPTRRRTIDAMNYLVSVASKEDTPEISALRDKAIEAVDALEPVVSAVAEDRAQWNDLARTEGGYRIREGYQMSGGGYVRESGKPYIAGQIGNVNDQVNTALNEGDIIPADVLGAGADKARGLEWVPPSAPPTTALAVRPTGPTALPKDETAETYTDELIRQYGEEAVFDSSAQVAGTSVIPKAKLDKLDALGLREATAEAEFLLVPLDNAVDSLTQGLPDSIAKYVRNDILHIGGKDQRPDYRMGKANLVFDNQGIDLREKKTAEKLAWHILRDTLEEQGVDAYPAMGPASGLTSEGKQKLALSAATKAQEILAGLEEALFVPKDPTSDPPAEPDMTAPDLPAPPGDPAEPDPSFIRDETGSINLGAMGRIGSGILRGIVNAGNAVFGEMTFPLTHLPSGQFVVRGLDRVSTREAMLVGPLQEKLIQANKNMTRQDRKWWAAENDQGYTNAQRMLEDPPGQRGLSIPGDPGVDPSRSRLDPPSPEIQGMVDTYEMMLGITGSEAERIGLMALDKKRGWIPFKQAQGGRYLRNFTPDAQQALMQGNGVLFRAIQKVVERDNDYTLSEAGEVLKESYGSPTVRRSGPMEHLRTIRHLPAVVWDENGVKRIIQETSPVESILGAAKAQAKRIYMAEEFGQGVEGEPTKLDRMRAQFQNAGGDVKAFDDVLAVFEGRPFKRVFADPRNPILRAARAADRVISTLHTSMSVLLNLAQTAAVVPKYTGAFNYLKAVGKTLRHPQMTTAQLTSFGAMDRSFLNTVMRPGQVPEDIVNLAAGVVTRYTGMEIISQMNEAISGAGGKSLADAWMGGNFSSKDFALAQDLRLSAKEVRQVQRGKMTAETYAKVTQNVSKISQYIREDPHRRSKMQNIPFWNKVVAYNSYIVGTTKMLLRTGRGTAKAFHPDATTGQRIAAAKWLLLLAAGMTTAGTVGLLLKRGAKGQPLQREDETILDILGKGLLEAGILGMPQRLMDVSAYSATTEQAAINLSPKVAALVRVAEALFSDGTWGEMPGGKRVKELVKGQTPLVKAANTWWNRMLHPEKTAYRRVRSMARTYRPRESKARNLPIEPAYYAVHDAILDDDPDAIQVAMSAYEEWAVAKGWDEKESRKQLRSSLSKRRPVNFNYATYREFLHSLSPEKRVLVEKSQAHYVLAMDELTLTPAEQAARTGDLEALTKELPGLQESEARMLVKKAMTKPIARKIAELNVDAALRVWEVSGEKERKAMRSALINKFEAAKSRMTPTELNALAAQFRIQGVFKR